jgi:MFS family permease
MVFLATLPLFLVVDDHRVAYEEAGSGLWHVFWLAPVIMLSNVVYAASVESIITFFPIFGAALGVSEEYALGLMTVIAVGGMLLVIPLGWLADKVDRMGMLAACVALTVLGFAFMPLAVQAPPWAGGVFAFVFGGVEGMIYALGVTLIGERFRGAALAAATTTFTAGWGAGTIIGPLVSGVGMDLLGNTTLAWIAGGFFLLYLPLPLWAWWSRRAAARA